MEAKLRVTLPPDPNTRKPKFKPPPGTIDTHFHVFGPPHLFPYYENRRYTPPAAPVEHFFGMAKIVGIDRGVMVQPTVHHWDSASTLDAIDKGDGRLRGMIHANPEFDDADIEKLHAGGVRGVRFNCVARTGGASTSALRPRGVAGPAARLGGRPAHRAGFSRPACRHDPPRAAAGHHRPFRQRAFDVGQGRGALTGRSTISLARSTSGSRSAAPTGWSRAAPTTITSWRSRKP